MDETIEAQQAGENDWSVESILDDWGSDIIDMFWGLLTDLVDVGADILETIPVPEFLGPLGDYVGSVPAEVLYFAQPFEIGFGLTVIGAALASRMLLSLIPVVGNAFR